MERVDLNNIHDNLKEFSCKGKVPIRIINKIGIGADFIANSEQEIGLIAKHMEENTYATVLFDGMMYEIKKYSKEFNSYIVSIMLSYGKFYGEE